LKPGHHPGETVSTRKERKVYMPDRKLDLNDIPEASDEQLHRARRVARPATGNAKQLIAIRIVPRLLAQLRRLAAKQSNPIRL
jgi:hypothetical protein